MAVTRNVRTATDSERPLRIGITSYPTVGGSGIIATELGRSLAVRGHDVHFLCYDRPGWLDPVRDRVSFHRVPIPDYPLPHLSAYALALASQLVELSESADLDLIHLHYAIPHATSAYLASQLLRAQDRLPPKIITTLHGTDVTVVGSDPALLPIHRFTLQHCDGLTTPSVYLRQAAYAQLGLPAATGIEVIPNFVDSERFAPLGEPSSRHVGLSRLLERPISAREAQSLRVLIHSSNFRPVKRLDDVLAVFAQVAQVRPAILLLVGDGPERPRIESLTRQLGLAESVYFLGQQQDFVDALQHSDVFLLPSASEGFGLSALEALSCGVPVVGSNVGGVPEVVEDGKTGLLCRVADVASMTQAVLRIVTEPGLHAEMAHAARQRVLGHFRQEPLVSRYEQYFRERLREPIT